MSYAVLCPGCRHQVAVQESMAGQAARCPHCAMAFQVPASPASRAPAPVRTTAPPRKVRVQAREDAPPARSSAPLMLGLLAAGIVIALMLVVSIGVVAYLLHDQSARAPQPKPTERRVAKSDATKPPVAAADQPAKAILPEQVKPLPEAPPPKTENPPPNIPLQAPPPLAREETPLEAATHEPPAKPVTPAPAETKTEPPAKVEEARAEPSAPVEAAPTEAPAKTETPRFAAGSRRLSGDQIYRRLVKATAFVRNTEGWGSGSLIHGERKLILTNYHVVGDDKEVAVSFPRYDAAGKLIVDGEFYQRAHKNGEFIRGKVLKVSKEQDLAVVQLEKVPEGTPVLKLAARSASPGEAVHSVGNPGASDARWSYTSGTVRQVSHKTWRAKVDRAVLTFDSEVVETQSPTNPGDSGGPLVNDALQLVGVTHGANVTARELSLFIDVGEVKKLLKACDVPLEDVVAPVDGPAEGEADTGDVFALIKLLQDRETANRVEAGRRLAALGPAARPAARALLKALKDDEPWVRRNAALALGKLGPDAAELVRKAVLAAVEDKDADVRLAALEALANLGPPEREEMPLLLYMLHDSVRRHQAKASLYLARTLARLGPDAKAAVPDLRTMLASEDRDIRLQAVQTLRKIGPEARKAAPELIELLKDTDKTLRLQAAFALVAGDPAMVGAGKDGLTALVLALRPAAADEKDETRTREITAVLVKLGKPAAEGLRRAIETEFRGGRSGSEAAKLNAAARETAVKIIADIGPAGHSPALITTLIELQRGDPSRAVRDAAKQAYIKLQNRN